MPGSIRPWVTTGIAVVGVTVIGIAPFDPAPPHSVLRISNSAVEFSATPSPFEFYPQVVKRSLDNAGELLAEYLTAPLPVATAIADSQYAALVDLVDAADDGDVVAFVDALTRAVANPVANMVKVLGTGEPFRLATSLIVRMALPIISGVIAAGSSIGDVFAALYEFDVFSAVGAATNLPARIIDGFLNGRVDAVGDDSAGLLSPVRQDPVVDQLTGPVAFLIDSLQGIADTISSPTPTVLGAGPTYSSNLAPAADTGLVAPPGNSPAPRYTTPEPTPPVNGSDDETPADDGSEPVEQAPSGPRDAEIDDGDAPGGYATPDQTIPRADDDADTDDAAADEPSDGQSTADRPTPSDDSAAGK